MNGVSFADLIKTLGDEVEIYKSFAENEDGKTAVIASGDVEKLDDMLNTGHMLHMKIQSAEKKRLEIMKGLGLEGKKLSQIIDLAEGREKEKLAEILDDLNFYTDSLKKINDYNARLVKSRLSIISALSDAFAEPSGQPGAAGKKKPGGKNTYYGKDAKVSETADGNDTPVLNKKI
jgi:acylphosphatase